MQRPGGVLRVPLADDLRLEVDQLPDPLLGVGEPPAAEELPGLLGEPVGLLR